MKTEREKRLEASLREQGYDLAELARGQVSVDDAPALVPILARALSDPAVPENLPDFDYRKGPEVCTEVVRRSAYTCPHCNNRVEVDCGPEPAVPEAVRRLPGELREKADNICNPAPYYSGRSSGMLSAVRQLERVIAQHGEGRAPEGVNAKYHELLYAVVTKHPGESRHETALRYIRQVENRPIYCEANSESSGENSDG